jgi:hypothetical protein
VKVAETNIYLIVIAFRKPLALEELDHPNILVLDRRALKLAYTPTLASRPHFYVPENKQT